MHPSLPFPGRAAACLARQFCLSSNNTLEKSVTRTCFIDAACMRCLICERIINEPSFFFPLSLSNAFSTIDGWVSLYYTTICLVPCTICIVLPESGGWALVSAPRDATAEKHSLTSLLGTPNVCKYIYKRNTIIPSFTLRLTAPDCRPSLPIQRCERTTWLRVATLQPKVTWHTSFDWLQWLVAPFAVHRKNTHTLGYAQKQFPVDKKKWGFYLDVLCGVFPPVAETSAWLPCARDCQMQLER